MYYIAYTQLGSTFHGQADTEQECLAIFQSQPEMTKIYVSSTEIERGNEGTLLAERKHVAFARWKATIGKSRQGGTLWYCSDNPSMVIGWPNLEAAQDLTVTDLEQASPMQQVQLHDAGRMLGKQIAQARHTTGLTQEELGVKMGFAPTSAKTRVAELEKGKNMTLATMLAVGNALGMGLTIQWQKL